MTRQVGANLAGGLDAWRAGKHDGVVAFGGGKDPDLTVETLKEFCRQNLTGYKRPKVIEFRD